MSNESSPKCPQCGTPLPADAPKGLCPQCLMALNLKTETALTDDTPTAQPPLPPEEIAPHFPKLEIIECLGRGGMGVVYKARQKSLNRLVALKLLAPERAGDPQFAARFEKEARALAALNHPNIVTIYDHGQAGGFYYLLMEFVDGVTLRQLLAKERVTAREALAIVPQICDALQFAHDQGIVHRDIKPENILLDRRGRVKVADFGLAKIIGGHNEERSAGGEPPKATGEITDAGKVMGTPQYMSPEQIQAPGEVDHRADIYALGVVFYQMLTGELPGKQLVPPSKKVQIDVRLDEVVLRALEQKPELRYQQASALKTQIETIASSSSDPRPEAARVQRGVPVRRWRDRWVWDTSNVILMAFVPLLIIPFAVFARGLSLLVWLPAGLGLLFAAINGLVGWRVRRLKASLPKSDAEVAEAMVFERPKRAPGIAILHDDRLELVGIAMIGRLVVRLDEISSLSEVRWFNGKRLWWKRGFVLDLKNGRRIGVAVPEPFGRRWRATLSGGSLPELPAIESIPDRAPGFFRPEVEQFGREIRSMLKSEGLAGVAKQILLRLADQALLLFDFTANIVPHVERDGRRRTNFWLVLLLSLSSIGFLVNSVSIAIDVVQRTWHTGRPFPFSLVEENMLLWAGLSAVGRLAALNLGGSPVAGSERPSGDRKITRQRISKALRRLLMLIALGAGSALVAYWVISLSDLEQSNISVAAQRMVTVTAIGLAVTVAGFLVASVWWYARLMRRVQNQVGKNQSAANQNPLPVSDFWLALEEGNYARAWDKAAPYLQRDFSTDEWVAKMEKERRPLGRGVDRKIVSVTVITPNTRTTTEVLTTFENGQRWVEGVICSVQPNGEWKVERYHIRPATQEAVAKAKANEVRLSRFSNAAIWGGGLNIFALIVVGVGALSFAGTNFTEPAVKAFAEFCLLPGVILAFAATILSWIAASQIRRSAGKLRGRWLAVLNGLVFAMIMIPFLISIMGLLANAVKARAITHPVMQNLSFGPVIERILRVDGNECDFLVLRSGDVLRHSYVDGDANISDPPTEFTKWVRKNGADVGFCTNANTFYSPLGLMTLDMAAFEFPSNTIPAAMVARFRSVEEWQAYDAFHRDSPAQNPVIGSLVGVTNIWHDLTVGQLLGPTNDVPAFFLKDKHLSLWFAPANFLQPIAFSTRNGLEGIMQITCFTDNPPSVKIRYKLVQ